MSYRWRQWGVTSEAPPGFRFDAKAGRESFEVIVVGTKSGVRWRETLDAATMDEALANQDSEW